jgi:hypothetical protein
MSAFYRDWKEAHTAAVKLARQIGHDVGLEVGDNPLDGKGFRIFSLPKPENRYGFELRCEVIHPDDPL